ncbi:MAG: hypothetical protein Q9162_000058 [Coniocarpon cinnabarinum]
MMGRKEDRRSADSPDLGSNKYVGRPPPLSSSVERELRDACEVVLKDLKPSGHDIEDRRMKSDMFVDHDPYNLTHNVRIPTVGSEDNRTRRQHSAAAWINNQSENIAQLQDVRHTRRDNQPLKPKVDTTNATRNAEQSRTFTRDPPNAMTPLSSHAVPPVESPLAPLPTNVRATPQPSMTASTKPLTRPKSAQRTDSVSTETSMPFTPSTDYFKSASTAATSNASSNRASENVFTQQPTAKDGAWMKQEVEKHKQAQSAMPSIAGTAGAAAVMSSDTAAKNGAAASDRSVTQQRRDSATIGDTEMPAVQRPAMGVRTSSRYSNNSVNSQGEVKSPTNSTGPARPGSNGSRRHSRPSSGISIEGIRETRTSPQPSPRNEDVPPVPRINSERLNSLTNSSRPNSTSQLAIDAIAQQHKPSQDTKQPSNAKDAHGMENKSTVEPRSSAHAATDMTSTTTSPTAEARTISPSSDRRPQKSGQVVSTPAQAAKSLPQLNMQNGDAAATDDKSPEHNPQSPDPMASPAVVVRDFFRPKPSIDIGMAPSSRRVDPTPADFEALMASMDGAVHGAPPNSLPPDQSASNHVNNAMPNGVPARRSSLQGQLKQPQLPFTPPPLPRLPSNKPNSHKAGVSEAPIDRPRAASQPFLSSNNAAAADEMIPQQRPPLAHETSGHHESPHSSVRSPTRMSEAYSSRTGTSTASRRERKGLSRMLWRLGGGDMPQRRKIYIPQYSGDGAYWEEDEEEACAAPVVGFGRGW